MRNDVNNVIDIILNLKIETPVFVYTGLPKILTFVVLFGAEGGVMQVLLQESHLLELKLYAPRRAGHQGTREHVWL
jgi:hypothetical protein